VEILLKLADSFFFVFHIGLIVFNLFGWMVKSMRKWNLFTLGLTAFSWFVIGAFYGFGYCFLTDWHWQIRDELGYPNPYNSYIHFLITEVFSITISEKMVDILTASLFFVAVVMSVITNLRDFKESRNRTRKSFP
jgi:hypothetical protein